MSAKDLNTVLEAVAAEAGEETFESGGLIAEHPSRFDNKTDLRQKIIKL